MFSIPDRRNEGEEKDKEEAVKGDERRVMKK